MPVAIGTSEVRKRRLYHLVLLAWIWKDNLVISTTTIHEHLVLTAWNLETSPTIPYHCSVIHPFLPDINLARWEKTNKDTSSRIMDKNVLVTGKSVYKILYR